MVPRFPWPRNLQTDLPYIGCEQCDLESSREIISADEMFLFSECNLNEQRSVPNLSFRSTFTSVNYWIIWEKNKISTLSEDAFLSSYIKPVSQWAANDANIQKRSSRLEIVRKIIHFGGEPKLRKSFQKITYTSDCKTYGNPKEISDGIESASF